MHRGTGSPCPFVFHPCPYIPAPWHFLNFFPLPQGQGSLRPTPAYGFAANAGSATPAPGLGGRVGGGASAAVTRPSAVGLDATIGVERRGGPPGRPPAGPVRGRAGPRPGGPPAGGPISICSLSHRSVNVAFRSCIKPTNIS